MINEPIFVITVFKKGYLQEPIENVSKRVIGFSYDFNIAQKEVLNNSLDMHECNFEMAVIEKVFPGLYFCARERWFYEYDSKSDKFFPVDCPKEFEKIINIGIG